MYVHVSKIRSKEETCTQACEMSHSLHICERIFACALCIIRSILSPLYGALHCTACTCSQAIIACDERTHSAQSNQPYSQQECPVLVDLPDGPDLRERTALTAPTALPASRDILASPALPDPRSDSPPTASAQIVASDDTFGACDVLCMYAFMYCIYVCMCVRGKRKDEEGVYVFV
jgi:hypothetical protein